MSSKSKIYVLVLIWAAALIQLFISHSINREEKMVEQAMSDGVNNLTESSVKAYAHYSDDELSDEARVLIVRNIAGELGVTSGYELNQRVDGDNHTLELKKYGKHADTKIKVISLVEENKYKELVNENYIMIEIDLKGNACSMADTYVEELEELYKDLGMDANTNVYTCSQHPGEMSEQEKKQEISQFLESMDASQVELVSFDGVSSCYGYSSNIDQYVFQGDEKVNVNIAFTYDEEQDVTYIHRAIPFIDKSF